VKVTCVLLRVPHAEVHAYLSQIRDLGGGWLEFELRSLHSPGRCSTTWVIPSSLFCFVCVCVALIIFLGRVLRLCPGQPGLRASCLCFLHSWDDRCTTPHPAFYWLRWGLMNFLPRLALNHNSPNLYLPCGWDYRHEPLYAAVYVWITKSKRCPVSPL
jgi:hypothetical protein